MARWNAMERLEPPDVEHIMDMCSRWQNEHVCHITNPLGHLIGTKELGPELAPSLHL